MEEQGGTEEPEIQDTTNGATYELESKSYIIKLWVVLE